MINRKHTQTKSVSVTAEKFDSWLVKHSEAGDGEVER